MISVRWYHKKTSKNKEFSTLDLACDFADKLREDYDNKYIKVYSDNILMYEY